MPQARDEAGNIWEVDAQGNPIRLVSQSPRAVQPNVIALPQTPQEIEDAARRRRDEGRAIDAAGRDATSLGLRIRDQSDQDTQRAFNNARALKGDFDSLPEVKNYKAILPLLMQGLYAPADPNGDQTLLYRYAKVMDPGSVVRESEQASAANTAGYWDATVANLKKQFGIAGGGLSQTTRDRLKRDMLAATQQMGLAYRQVRDRYTDDARTNGIDPRQVIGPDAFDPYVKQYEAFTKRQAQQPQQGASGAQASGVTPWQFTGPGSGGGGFAAPGSPTKAIPITPGMQAEYEAYVKPRLGQLDPQEYAAFRNDLAGRYGFGSNPQFTQTYEDEANRFNADAKAGRQLNLNIPAAETAMTAQDRINNSIYDNPAGAAALGVGSLGGFADEAVGYGKALVNGTDPDVEIAKANAIRQGLAAKYPKSTLAGNVAGALATGYGAGALLPGAALTDSALGTIGTGAAYGGISGAGENNDNRMLGALIGTGAGTAGGTLGRYVLAPSVEAAFRTAPGQAVSRAGRSIWNSTAGRSGLSVAPEAAIPNFGPGERLLPSVSSLADATNNLRDAARLGIPYSLSDADPQLRLLAGSVSRKSPSAYSMAEDALDPRGIGQADRAIESINRNLAPITDVRTRTQDILDAGKPVYGPLYDQAYAAAPVTSPRIEQVLGTPAGRQAVGRANSIAANEFRDPKSLGFAVDANGDVVLNPQPLSQLSAVDSARAELDAAQEAYRSARRTPGANSDSARSRVETARYRLRSAQQNAKDAPVAGSVMDVPAYTTQSLDYVKRGIDDILEPQRNPITGKLNLDEGGRAVAGVKSALTSEIDKLNPAYGDARNAYGFYAKQSEGLGTGRGMFGNTMPDSDFNTLLGRTQAYDAGLPEEFAGQAVLPEVQRGYATAMGDKVNSMRLSGNPWEAIYGSPNQQARVASLFPEGFSDFARTYGLERDMAKTNREVLGGSPTAARLAADQRLENPAMDMVDAGAQLATGGGLRPSSVIDAGRTMLGDTLRVRGGQKKAEQLAPILFNTDPNAALGVLDALALNQSLDAIRKGAIRRRSGMFGSLVAPTLVPSF